MRLKAIGHDDGYELVICINFRFHFITLHTSLQRVSARAHTQCICNHNYFICESAFFFSSSPSCVGAHICHAVEWVLGAFIRMSQMILIEHIYLV